MKSMSWYVCSRTTRSHVPKVGIDRLELPQTTSSRSGSICRIALATWLVILP